MTNETLKQVLDEVASLPEEAVEELGPSLLYHELDHKSPLRDSGYPQVGHLFLRLRNDDAVCGVYFWLNLEVGKWDVHFYTAESHRRSGLATSLFREGVLPWLQANGYSHQEICTKALASESVGLLLRLGFEACGQEFRFVVP